MVRRLILIAALLISALAVSAVNVASAQESAWQEGATLVTGTCGIQGGGYRIVNINALKSVDRSVPSRTSNFQIYVTSGVTPANTVNTLIGPVTVAVPIDPDYLSVSRDLGWAGLDATVSLYDSAVQANVTVAVHLQWTANSGVTQEGNLYKRNATITGTVTLKDRDYLLACVKSGYIFSTREPKPRY